MRDSFGRTLDYLRISVTDRCNLRCVYCMPPEGVEWKPHESMLRFEEIRRLCGIFACLGFRKIKITGGEPLVRRGVIPFIRDLKTLPGIEQVTLTTNGLLLASCLEESSGFPADAVNISLDTLDKEKFKKITLGRGLDEILGAVEILLARNIPVKINCVPIRGLNEDDVLPLASLAKERNLAVRFIELMPAASAGAFRAIPEQELFARLEKALGSLRPFSGGMGNGPARYYTAAGFAGKIGFISPLSRSFCDTCNRLRLSSQGLLKLCLASEEGRDLRSLLRGGASGEELERAIREEVFQKPRSHSFSFTPGVPRHSMDGMFRIGG
jgi:cyclic pyranopterin phosphate synthase